MTDAERVVADPEQAALYRTRLDKVRQQARRRRLRRRMGTVSDVAVRVITDYPQGQVPDPNDPQQLKQVLERVEARLSPIMISFLLNIFVKFILPILIKWLLSKWQQKQDVAHMSELALLVETISDNLAGNLGVEGANYATDVALILANCEPDGRELCDLLAEPLREIYTASEAIDPTL